MGREASSGGEEGVGGGCGGSLPTGWELGFDEVLQRNFFVDHANQVSASPFSRLHPRHAPRGVALLAAPPPSPAHIGVVTVVHDMDGPSRGPDETIRKFRTPSSHGGTRERDHGHGQRTR